MKNPETSFAWTRFRGNVELFFFFGLKEKVEHCNFQEKY